MVGQHLQSWQKNGVRYHYLEIMYVTSLPKFIAEYVGKNVLALDIELEIAAHCSETNKTVKNWRKNFRHRKQQGQQQQQQQQQQRRTQQQQQ